MSNELLIHSTDKSDRIILLQNKKIVEYHVEEKGNTFTVGDICFGTVKKLVPGLNAAFIDIGYEKDAFLHYQDLGPNFNTLQKFLKANLASKEVVKLSQVKIESEIDKTGKITNVLNKVNQILVQIVKEPISTKGPRLSSELSLAGRNLVLVPFNNQVSISKKIASREERTRLHRLLSSIKPANFGIIVRTVAEGKDVAELYEDLESLMERWDAGIEKIRTATPPQKLIGEVGRASAILRDVLNESFDNIVTDDKIVHDDIKAYIRRIAPEKEKIVRLHNNKIKLFESQGIEKQLKLLFGKSVSLPNGGYLIIEHTEALHVIDVNSGNKAAVEQDQEATALSVNIEAVREVARQMRIRDLGGIIIIDFIDMRKISNKRMVYETMKEELKKDRSKATALPLTKFGLMQITRQRVRPQLNISTHENCPTCNGTGKIEASILVSDIIQANVEHLATRQKEKHITLTLHPYLYAYFTKGWMSEQVKWYFKYKKWIHLVADSSSPLLTFVFTNKLGEPIEITQA